MRVIYVCLIALMVGVAQTACSDHDADDKMAAMTNAGECEIVFANGLGVSIPEVISAADKTAKNDALAYYASLGKKGQNDIINGVYQRAQKTFKCVAESAGTTCTKHSRVSLGIGHLPKLKKDILTVYAERSCQAK
ncbi:MAG: hypothetical protein R8K53_06720 [Mariprofundaceae bacterium]